MSDSSMDTDEDDPRDLPGRNLGQDFLTQASSPSHPPLFPVFNITYTPLDEDFYQIRLISILPHEGDSNPVRCAIETVSLQSYSSKYHEFISKCTSSGRKRVIEWNNAHTRPSRDDTLRTYTPDPSSHRFTWGDYAALSYVCRCWGRTPFPILTCHDILPRQYVLSRNNPV